MLDNRLFNQILETYRSNSWLMENEQLLFEAIQDDLRNADEIEMAIQSLVLIFPRMFELQSPEIKSWGKLMREAFNRLVSQEEDFVFANPLDNGINGIFVVQMRESPSQLPTKTRRKKREIVHPFAFLEMYIVITMMQFYEAQLQITSEMMHDMVVLARAVNDPYLCNKMYQAVAFIHNHYGNFAQARAFAEKAWDFWMAIPNPMESFLSASALYIAHTGLGDADQATYWRDILKQIDDPQNAFGQRNLLAHLKGRF